MKYFNSRPSARGDAHHAADAVRSKISIHAPPRGATSSKGRPAQTQAISIHAPPRGATAPCWLRASSTYFNSRPSARGDAPVRTGQLAASIFQFTPLREGRHQGKHQAVRHGHFNSRPSARGDAGEAGRAAEVHVFQFTPLREGRPEIPRIIRPRIYFNSRPSARGDHDG